MINEDDMRGVANRGIVARKLKAAGLVVHVEDGDVIGSLIPTVKKPTGGIEAEAAWIVASCPFFANEREIALQANRKDADAVMEPVARVDEFPVIRNKDFRTEVTSGEARRER